MGRHVRPPRFPVGFPSLTAAKGRLRVAEDVPLIEEARVDLADCLAQPGLQVVEGRGLGRLRNGLDQRLVSLGQVAQHHPLGALQTVEFHVLAEVEAGLEEFPGHRLWAHHFVAHPGVVGPEHLEGAVQKIG